MRQSKFITAVLWVWLPRLDCISSIDAHGIDVDKADLALALAARPLP